MSFREAPALPSTGPPESLPDSSRYHFQIHQCGAETRDRDAGQHGPTSVRRWREKKPTTANVNVQKGAGENTTQKSGSRPVRKRSTPATRPTLRGLQSDGPLVTGFALENSHSPLPLLLGPLRLEG